MQTGMNRRHFLSHVAGAAALAVPTMRFLQGLHAAQTELKKENKSLIILWMGGGPSHMDLWDLKPGARPAASSSRSRPRPPASRSAKSCPPSPSSSSTCRIVRSLVTNEGSHERGTVLMNTGRHAQPGRVQYPAMGAVASPAADRQGPAPARLHRRRRHRPAHRARLPRHELRSVHRPERRPAARPTSSPQRPGRQRPEITERAPPPAAPVLRRRRHLLRERLSRTSEQQGRQGNGCHARSSAAAPPRPTPPSTRRAST